MENCSGSEQGASSVELEERHVAQTEGELSSQDHPRLENGVAGYRVDGESNKRSKPYLSKQQCKVLEIACLVAVTVVAWALLLLPIIFFYLPVDSKINVSSN